MSAADVDHFIPFSQYPRDLAHNFVLAHPTCNRSKSDALAARLHLLRWLDRLIDRSATLADIGQTAGIVSDVAVSRQVAAWSYANAHAAGGHAWIAPTQYEAIDASYGDAFDTSWRGLGLRR